MNRVIGIFLAAAFGLNLSAAVLTYNVSIGGVSSIPNGPGEIFLDFGASSGTVGADHLVISNFSPSAQLGVVDNSNSSGPFSGSLSSSLTLTSAAPRTNFAQNYTYNGAPISFLLQLTTAAGGTSPSVFDFALTDINGNGYLTSDPNGNLLTITINTNGNATTTTYNSQTGGPSPVTVAAVGAVPEPATYSLLAAGLGAIAFFQRKR